MEMEEVGDSTMTVKEAPVPVLVEHIDRKGRRVFKLHGMKKQSPGLKTRPKYFTEEFNIFKVWRSIVLEFMATTLFVFFACGSVVANNSYLTEQITPAANVLAAVVQGYAIATLVYAIAHTSGGHINPAVTVSLVASGHVGLIRGAFYIAAQIVGGICGAGLLAAVIPNGFEGGLGATDISNNVTPGEGFLFEFIMTFMLIFTVFGTAINTESTVNGSHVLAPLPIGFAVAIGVGIAYTFTGGSLNPARSFGPAVIKGHWHVHYIYWCGPIGAGLVVGLLERYVFLVEVDHTKQQESVKGNSTGRVQTKEDLREIEEGRDDRSYVDEDYHAGNPNDAGTPNYEGTPNYAGTPHYYGTPNYAGTPVGHHQQPVAPGTPVAHHHQQHPTGTPVVHHHHQQPGTPVMPGTPIYQYEIQEHNDVQDRQEDHHHHAGDHTQHNHLHPEHDHTIDLRGIVHPGAPVVHHDHTDPLHHHLPLQPLGTAAV